MKKNPMAQSQVSSVAPGSHPPGWVASLLCAFLIGWISTSTTCAQIRFDAFLGHDSLVPELAWFPVTFEIKNDGPSFVGWIEVREQVMGGQNQQTTRVELPTGTLKRIQVPYFSAQGFSTEWQTRLLDENGNVKATTVVRSRGRIGWQQGGVGSLARTPIQSPQLPNVPLQNLPPIPAPARWLVDFFPENPVLLEGISTIYLNSEKAVSLKAPQVTALIQWMQAGGHLVVAIESPADLGGAPWLRRILPSQPGPSQNVVAGPFLHQYATNGWPSFQGRLQKDADKVGFVEPHLLAEDPTFATALLPVWNTPSPEGSVTLSAGSLPLFIQSNRGWGKITLLTFNPEREPFASWSHRAWFWGNLCNLASLFSSDQNHYSQFTSDGVFGTFLDSRQIHKLPVGWLILLLIIYLGIIGPFDRWWLKKINRPMLTWITFPIYVCLFSTLIYYLGYKLRAGESEWNEFQLVDAIPWGETTQARVRSYGSVYSPSNVRHNFGGLQQVAMFRSEVRVNGTMEAQKGRIENSGTSYKAEMPIPVWTSRLFVQDSWSTNSVPLRITLRENPVQGTEVLVENGFSSKISMAYIVDGSRLYTLNQIPVGSSKFKLSDLPTVWTTDFQPENMRMIQAGLQRRSETFGWQSENDVRRAHPLAAITCISLASYQWNQKKDDWFSISHAAGIPISVVPTFKQPVAIAWIEKAAWIPSMGRFEAARSSSQICVRTLVNRELNFKP